MGSARGTYEPGARRGLRVGRTDFTAPWVGLATPGAVPKPQGWSRPAHARSLLPPQENGGEPQSNSVSENPSSPGPLAASPDSGETHSEVGLGMPGRGGGWKVGSGLSPHRGAVPGGTVGLMQPLAPQPDAQEGDKHHSATGSLLDLNIPLAVAKERAHQKRTSKRAPQMDWSKKNELFSNL